MFFSLVINKLKSLDRYLNRVLWVLFFYDIKKKEIIYKQFFLKNIVLDIKFQILR